MIFDQQFRHPILAGKKTRHTLPLELGLAAVDEFGIAHGGYVAGKVVPAQTLQMVAGDAGRESLGIQRPARKKRKVDTFERLHLVGAREGALAEVSQRDAVSEGHKNLSGFTEWWASKGWDDGTRDHHDPVDVPVLVVYFELERLRKVEVMADVRRGRGDYTTGSGIDDAGVVRVDELSKGWTDEARDRMGEAKRADMDRAETRKLTGRLRSVKARCRATGVDGSVEVAEIEAQILKLEQRLDQAA